MNGEILSDGQRSLTKELDRVTEELSGLLQDPELVMYLKLRDAMRKAQQEFAKYPTEENKNRFSSLYAKAEMINIPEVVIQQYDRLARKKRSLVLELRDYQ